MLPVKVPNLLVNGADGIAVGMTTSIPPHNLGEVVDAVKAYMRKESITNEELMEYIEGPDFPTGGLVINKKDLLNIYSSGTGKLKLRGKVTFESAKKRGEKDKLVISEIPYTMIGNNISKFLSDTVALIENKVTTDILDISKIESGKLEFIYTSFRLNEIFQPQERAFSFRAEPGVRIIFETDGNDYYIESEKTRLTQVLTNFLSNAVKFTSSGSIRFGYRLTETGIYVYVTDTGSGIAKKHLSTVFDRFVKLDMFKQGTGLGLSICKTIISILKGEIGVESEEGKGSTFWFTIPCSLIKVS